MDTRPRIAKGVFNKMKYFVYSVFLFLGLHRLIRHINRDKILVVMYHGVPNHSLDVPCGCQLPYHSFTEQIDYLHTHYTILPLADVADMLQRGESPPPHTAVITFDDGYHNNTHACRYLIKFDIPATLFITTGLIGTQDILWPDIIYLAVAQYHDDTVDLAPFGLKKYILRSHDDRRDAYEDINAALKALPGDKKNELLQNILRLMGYDTNTDLAKTFSMLSWDEVHDLSESNLITIGAHSVYHEILTRLTPPNMKNEVSTSCRDVLRETGRLSHGFAYPNGEPDDYNADVITALKDEHVSCAVTAIRGLNAADQDVFQLKRIGVDAETTISQFKIATSGLRDTVRKLLGQ